MRPPRTQPTRNHAAVGDEARVDATACSGDVTQTRPLPGTMPDGRGKPARAPDFLVGLAVRDHVRLAERLAEHVGELRQAYARESTVDATRARLDAFLMQELIPYMRNEEAALYAGSVTSHAPGRLGGARRPRRTRRRLRDHRQIVVAAGGLRSAETTAMALARAEQVRTLLDKHLTREDRELLIAAPSRPDGKHRSVRSLPLATELQDILAEDHARIARAIALARSSEADLAEELDGCDRATAALSQHAAVMATRAYPMAKYRVSGPDDAGIATLRHDLRSAERALRHLNRTLRGAAGENFNNRQRLWDEVEQAWQRHVADEEPLIRNLAPTLSPDHTLSLIAALRRPAGRSLTRQHPALLRGGWPTRTAIHAQYRLDRWRDVLDNRESLRSGR